MTWTELSRDRAQERAMTLAVLNLHILIAEC